jgi:hypothetical protein
MAKGIRTPTDVTRIEALRDPSRIPFETRRKAAMQLLMHEAVDGWEALALTLFGRIVERDETRRARS